jgi:hypothetical protein
LRTGAGFALGDLFIYLFISNAAFWCLVNLNKSGYLPRLGSVLGFGKKLEKKDKRGLPPTPKKAAAHKTHEGIGETIPDLIHKHNVWFLECMRFFSRKFNIRGNLVGSRNKSSK